MALAEDDPLHALQTNASGVFNYVRRAEIEAFADASHSNCILILTAPEDIRALQKCSSIAAEIKDNNLV